MYDVWMLMRQTGLKSKSFKVGRRKENKSWWRWRLLGSILQIPFFIDYMWLSFGCLHGQCFNVNTCKVAYCFFVLTMKCEELFYSFFSSTFYKRRGGLLSSAVGRCMLPAWRTVRRHTIGSCIFQHRDWDLESWLMKTVQKLFMLPIIFSKKSKGEVLECLGGEETAVKMLFFSENEYQISFLL